MICHTKKRAVLIGIPLRGIAKMLINGGIVLPGGVTSRFLELLLEHGIADAVLCVRNTNNAEKLFEYVTIDSAEQVSSCAKSVYYPVEISEALRNVIDGDKKVAIVGLPCTLASIRSSMSKLPKLQKKIVCLIGLVCGQMKSSFYTDYLIERSGISKTVTSVAYRCKDLSRSAANYLFKIKGNSEEKQFGYHDFICKIWESGMFKLDSCFTCSDVFAESADIVFMDAWLPEYSAEPYGWNLILSRNEKVSRLLMQDDLSHIEVIPLDKVLKSQAGPVFLKQQLPSAALQIKKCFNPVTRIKKIKMKQLHSAFYSVSQTSKNLWKQGVRGSDFDNQMQKHLDILEKSKCKYARIEKIEKLCRHPLKTIYSVVSFQMKRFFKR